jgi:hypothetical protein
VLDIINELCYYLIAVLFFGFSEIIDDPQLKYNIGWPVIGILIFQIATNMGLILTMSLKNMYLAFKRCLCNKNQPQPLSQATKMTKNIKG